MTTPPPNSEDLDDYLLMKAKAAETTSLAHDEPSANTYRTAAAAHRIAARTAERAGLAGRVAGHELAALSHDETAERLAADRRAESLRVAPTWRPRSAASSRKTRDDGERDPDL